MAASEPSGSAGSSSPPVNGSFAVGGTTTGRIVMPDSVPKTPKGMKLSGRKAIRIANSDPNVDKEKAENGKLNAFAEAKPPLTWQIGYFANGKEVVQVLVDDPSGQIRESWTGNQVAWEMARGYSGAFGHKLNAPYVWLPLALLFFFGLLDWRRPWRIVHLDLLVLLSFGISQIFFNNADIGVSVPLAYPPLLYLLARMLWIGFRGPGEGLRPTFPIQWMMITLGFLVGFRVALNMLDSGVIDVGYSGVSGADLITHGHAFYGDGVFPNDNPTGDTYGPVNYFAYVPFELIFPWSGTWDDLPAAHAAAIAFDSAVLVLLFLIGRRMRPGRAGTDLGVILCFAWAAYPYTDYVLQSNSNDSLVAVFVLGALCSSPRPRHAAHSAR